MTTLVIGGNPPPVSGQPILLTPPNGSVRDMAGTPSLTWTFQPGFVGDTPTGYALRRKASGTSTYHFFDPSQVGAARWASTSGVIVPYTLTAGSITFLAGDWPNGVTYDWSVETFDSGGGSGFPPDFIVIAQAAPVVSSVLPAGTVATASPPISWTTSLPTGVVQTSYRAVIYPASVVAEVGFVNGQTDDALVDTGIISGTATSVPVTAVLPNSSPYVVMVQITVTGGATSAWTPSNFNTAYIAPANPTIPTATFQSDGGNGVLLVAQGHDVTQVGPTTANFTYSDDQGTTWFPIRYGTALPVPPAGQQASVIDHEVPPGFSRIYNVTFEAVHSGNVVASAPAVAAVKVPSTLRWWFKDPLNPSANMAVSLAPGTFDTVSTDRQQSVPIMTRPDPVILSDAFSLPLLTFTLVFISDAEYQAFEALRATQHILLFQGPYPMGQYYVRLGPTKNDSTNLPSLRWLNGDKVVRTVQISAQAVAAP